MQRISKRYKRNFSEMHKKIIHPTVGLKVLMEKKELQGDTKKKSKQKTEKSNS
jgi:hypothetical protein